MPKIRISQRLESGGIPANVAAAIRETAARYPSIKSFSIALKPAGMGNVARFYAAEGDSYTVVYNGRAATVEMQAAHNMGASGLSPAIGSEFALPIGAWLITVWYYGGFGMSVTNVTNPQIPSQIGA